MVQPFGNIPQLDDPGVGNALSASASTIGNLLNLRGQRASDRQSLINKLIGEAGAMQRQQMSTGASLEAAALKRAQIEALLGEFAGGLGLEGSTQAPMPDDTQAIGDIPSAPPLIAESIVPGVPDAVPLRPTGDGVTTPLTGGISAEEEVAPAATGASPGIQRAIKALFLGGNEAAAISLAKQAGLTPQGALDLSKGQREERIGAATEEADISKSLAQSKKAEIDLEAASLGVAPERLKGRVFENFKEIASTAEQTDLFDPVSTNKIPLKGLRATPNVQAALGNNAARYAADPKLVLNDRTENTKDGGVVTDLVGTMAEMEDLIQPGLQAQITRNATTGDLVIDLSGNAANARLKQKARSLSARLTRAARAMGERGVVTEPDVQKIKELFPDMLGSKERFEAALGEAATTLLGPVLKDAAALANAPTWNPGNELYNKIFGQDFAAFELEALGVERGQAVAPAQAGLRERLELMRTEDPEGFAALKQRLQQGRQGG